MKPRPTGGLSNLNDPYPGRGIVIGKDQKGNIIQIYWIMGRSDNSRNRILSTDNHGNVWTEPADPSKILDPSLIIYNAMLEKDGLFAVSNGNQTDKIIKLSFTWVLHNYTYEPDTPNFTPRILAAWAWSEKDTLPYPIAILRKSKFDDSCERCLFSPILTNGLGFCVTTYDGAPKKPTDPLPPFSGSPYPVPIEGDIDNIANIFWESLNQNNRIALVVKSIDIKTKISTVTIINKYEKMTPS